MPCGKESARGKHVLNFFNLARTANQKTSATAARPGARLDRRRRSEKVRRHLSKTAGRVERQEQGPSRARIRRRPRQLISHVRRLGFPVPPALFFRGGAVGGASRGPWTSRGLLLTRPAFDTTAAICSSFAGRATAMVVTPGRAPVERSGATTARRARAEPVERRTDTAAARCRRMGGRERGRGRCLYGPPSLISRGLVSRAPPGRVWPAPVPRETGANVDAERAAIFDVGTTL